jgi:hypothetical protein
MQLPEQNTGLTDLDLRCLLEGHCCPEQVRPLQHPRFLSLKGGRYGEEEHRMVP